MTLFRVCSFILALLCLAFGGPAGALAQSAPKWRHGLISAKGDAGIFFMAVEKGLFRKRGLDVEYVELRGDVDVIRALVAGQLDSAELSPAQTLVANERGATLKIVGSTMIGYPYALYVRNGIASWAELEGKTFGVSAPGSTPDLIAREMLRRKGIDPSSIKIANVGGTSSRIQALVSGRIDATAASSEYLPEQERLGIKALGLAGELVPEWPRFTISIDRKTIEARRGDAVKFLAGAIEGLNYALAHREETIALGAKLAKAPPSDPVFAAIFDEVKSGGYISPTGEIPVDKIKWLQDVLLRAGEDLTKPADVDAMVDPSIHTEALAVLAQ